MINYDDLPNQVEDSPNSGIKKEPWFAVCLSMLFPGSGLIYAGKYVLALTTMLLYLGGVITGFYLIVGKDTNLIFAPIFFLIAFIVMVVSIFLSFYAAKKCNTTDDELIRKSGKDTWLAVFLTSIIPGIGHFYIKKIGVGFLLLAAYLVSFFIEFENAPILNLIISIVLSITFMLIMILSSPVKRNNTRILATILISIYIMSSVIGMKGGLYIVRNLYQRCTINGMSMSPTINDGDMLIINKMEKNKLKRWDIITFKTNGLETILPENTLIKRIVALEGETVRFLEDGIYIDNKKLENLPLKYQWYVGTGKYGYSSSYTVPEGSAFVIGDNMSPYSSIDSRTVGAISKENIVGKAIKIIFPFDRARALYKEGISYQ